MFVVISIDPDNGLQKYISTADMSHPSTYKAYAFTEKGGQLQLINVPWKNPAENKIVVKVLACGVCGGDEIVKNQPFATGLPRVPGHELIGDVAAVSPNEKTFKVGERVGGGWHGGHCFNYADCCSGNFVVCQNAVANGIVRDGGYAEYAILRTEAVVRIPEGMDPIESAPLLCADSLRNMDLKHGDFVAVQGIGGLGHLGVQYVSKMGDKTIALSTSSAKRDICLQLGATAYLDSSKVHQAAELQKMGGAKVIMCCGPDVQAIRSLVGGLANDGTLLVLAAPAEDLVIPTDPLILKRLAIRGWACGSPKDCEDCIVYAKDMDIKTIIQTFPLDQAQEAYNHRSARFRAVNVP